MAPEPAASTSAEGGRAGTIPAVAWNTAQMQAFRECEHAEERRMLHVVKCTRNRRCCRGRFGCDIGDEKYNGAYDGSSAGHMGIRYDDAALGENSRREVVRKV
jgi:hypothetical protein